MANLLVTGGAGFIGANFVRRHRREKPNDVVVVLDALTYSGNRHNLAGLDDVDLVEGDICDLGLVSSLLAGRQIETIVHFAAETHVDRSIAAPDAFVTTNVIGTHTLLKAAKVNWLDKGSGRSHRFHHVSTDEVYGSLSAGDPPFSEETPYAPNSPYSASKAGSDHLVRAYHHTFGLQTTVTNCSNNYGPYQFPEKLIPLFMLNALAGRPLPIYGDGMNVRDWLHVDDHCRAIELVLANGRVGETYNVGGRQELPNLEIVDKICAGVDRAFAADPTLADRYPHAPAAKGRNTADLKTFVTDRQGHDFRYAIDDAKLREELGYNPARNFDEGFAATLEWYLEHEDWWRPLIAEPHAS